MTSEDFLAWVEADLQLRHVPFDLAELQQFVEDIWPLIEPDDDPSTGPRRSRWRGRGREG
jgi:hypothetical protein